MDDWADSTGTVRLRDDGDTPVDGYPYKEFVSYFSWTPPEPGGVPFTKILKKRQRWRNTHGGWWPTNGIVVQQYGIYGTVVQSEIDDTQRTAFRKSIGFVAQNDLDGSRLNGASEPPAILSAADWNKLKYLLLTNHTLSHFHYFGNGSDSHLGTRGGPNEQITTALLDASPRLSTNLLTYVALDGFVSGDGDLLKYFIGYNRIVSWEELTTQQGLWPYCFGWGWTSGKTNFANSLHFQFIKDFYDNLAAGFTYRESYERARLLPDGTENVESRYFKAVGYFDGLFPW